MNHDSDHHPGITDSLAWTVATLGLGVALRLAAASQGHNFDMDCWRSWADLAARGGTIYLDTAAHPSGAPFQLAWIYGPVWFYLLHGLDLLPSFGVDPSTSLSMKIAIFLTAVDVGIFAFLRHRYSALVATLFFLNPISIVITGFHRQFENLAILVALLSVASFRSDKGWRPRILASLGLGVSLSVKHILFAFPLWLAFRERSWSARITVVAIPYALFLSGFAFYLPGGWDGIVRGVFLYRSLDNAPFWAMFAPHALFVVAPKILLYLSALILVGVWCHEKAPLDGLLIYLVSMVVFSSAIANQYLAIPVVSAAVLWNWGYALYAVAGSVFLAVHPQELYWGAGRGPLRWVSAYGHYLLVLFLGAGLLVSLVGKERVRMYADRSVAGLRMLVAKLREQFSLPW
jgi:hypothetical protein